MRPLSAAEILRIWESDSRQEALDRAVSLLEGCAGRKKSADAGLLPVGERDRRLWEIRKGTFGPRVEALTDCPRCEAAIEFEFQVEEVELPEAPERASEHEWNGDGWTVRFRLPHSGDLSAIAGEHDAASALKELTGRCFLHVEHGGVTQPATETPASVRSAVEVRMAELDPQAEVRMDLRCPVCGETWEGIFDIADFLWTQIGVAARRLIRDVDLLARRYGWSEPEILALSAVRRQAYLELAAS